MMLDAAEVAKHNSPESCWVIISNNVYDVTDFLSEHPGGPRVIMRLAGKDATEDYEPIHPNNTLLKHLPKDKHLGPIDPSTLSTTSHDLSHSAVKETPSLPPLSVCQNLDDFEAIAKKKLSRKAWVYYNSAADDLASLKSNRRDWSKILLRPRVLRNVTQANMKRRIMGHESSLPFFIAPTAMAKLGHPDGEMCLAKAAVQTNIVYCASNYSSVSHEELANCFVSRDNSGALTFQLYVPKKKEDAVELIDMARNLGCKALVITVDTAVVGKREEDERYQAELEAQDGLPSERTFDFSGGEDASVFRGYHSSTLDWDDIRWIKKLWKAETGPVYLKGIQTAEDAYIAAQIGVEGIYLSNHGGRQLDYAPSSVRTLLEIRKFYPEVFDMLEVYVDGGVRRGTDIVKALCLGATGVGLGRPFLYALSAYGTEGVAKAIEFMSNEIQTTMRLMGVTDINQLDARYVNVKALTNELPDDLPSPKQLMCKL